MKTSNTERSQCPINLWLELFGDRWTLLLMRDMLIHQKKTFKEFMQSPEKISTNILADRLKFMLHKDLVTVEHATANKLVKFYTPTAKMKTLVPLLKEIDHWSSSVLSN